MVQGVRTKTLVCALAALSGFASAAQAGEIDQARIKGFQDQIAALQAQLNALTQSLARAEGGAGMSSASGAPPGPSLLAVGPSGRLQAAAPSAAAPSAATQETTALASAANLGPPTYAFGERTFERKPGGSLTVLTHGGEVTGYGVLDVSVEGASKGMGALRAPDGSRPIGNLGWMPEISTNLSYLGVRGFQSIPGGGLRFIYQLETQIELSATSGLGSTNSSESDAVKGGLTSRNTYIGLASDRFGAVSMGKTDAPYKQSTARMNPFIGMLGDYGAIMGNTGGDNRVEFGTRLDHAIWYESPQIVGLKFNALFSPGQNRASDSDNIAAGESDCTGGNIPGSGGSLPIACNDGAFSDAVSASLTYTRGPLYLVAAYERHNKVNRSSDLTGEYADPPTALFNADTADEDAAKVGAQYAFATGTTVSGVFETLHRYTPSVLAFQNERQRIGAWLSVTQQVSARGLLAFGWAHAGRTPGDPGQHDTSTSLPPLGSPGDGVGGAHVDNAADLLTAAFKVSLGAGVSAYVNWAMVLNGPYAHFALGAGGRAVTIDCHDASDATGGLASDPHCWAGAKPQGASTGLRYQF